MIEPFPDILKILKQNEFKILDDVNVEEASNFVSWIEWSERLIDEWESHHQCNSSFFLFLIGSGDMFQTEIDRIGCSTEVEHLDIGAELWSSGRTSREHDPR
jgi:hypothetical protein